MLLILKSTGGQNAAIEKTVNKITTFQNHMNDSYFLKIRSEWCILNLLYVKKSLQLTKISLKKNERKHHGMKISVR